LDKKPRGGIRQDLFWGFIWENKYGRDVNTVCQTAELRYSEMQRHRNVVNVRENG